jgi:hypothetical protein
VKPVRKLTSLHDFDFEDDELVEILVDTGAGAVAVTDVDPPLDLAESDLNTGIFKEWYEGGTDGIEALGADRGDVLVFEFGGETVSVPVKGYTADVSSDKDSYTVSETVEISVKDNDMNIDSGDEDEVEEEAVDPDSGEMILTIEADSGIYTADLDETDDDTGDFTGKFTFTLDIDDMTGNIDPSADAIAEGAVAQAADDDPTIYIIDQEDETLTITYYDRDIGGNPRTPEVEIDFEVTDVSISLDRTEYPRGATVYVTIADPDLNKDADVVESINRFRVEVTGTGIAGDIELDVNLAETGANTGVFESTIKLVDQAGVTWTPGETYTVEYEALSSIENPDEDGDPDADDVDFDLVSYTGSVKMDKNRYGPFASIIITVTDPDVNRDSGFKETVADIDDVTTGNVELRILKTGEGIDETYDLGDLDITFKETGANTGIFKETIDIMDLPANDIDPDEDALIGATIKVVYQDNADASGDEADSEAALARITSRTGSLGADNTNPPLNYEVTITISDSDRNLDSGGEDEIPQEQIVIEGPLIGPTLLSDLEDDAPNSDPSAVEETGDDTGVFEFTFVISLDADDEPEIADIGDTISIFYYDPFPSGAETNPIDATYENAVDPDTAIDGRDIPDAEEVSIDIVVLSAKATLALDKDVYSLFSKVMVTVNDLDRNLDDDEEDEIFVSVTSSAPGRLSETRIRELKVDETGDDTGIFEGDFVLNGEETGTGIYGEDSVIVRVGDSITVRYDDAGVNIVGTAQILQVTAMPKFDKIGYNFGDTATVTVEDWDYDMDPDIPDQIQALLNSSTDSAGVKVTLT